MIKRKLVMACLFVLAVQLARVCLLADTKDQQMTLAEEIPDGTEVSVSGTVEWVREKEKITAVCLRKNQVRYAGTILKESKLVVCIRPDQLKEQLNIGDKVIAEGEKESFDAARNPGNFDQKEYYRKQGIHVKVRADTLEKQSEKSLLYDRIKNEMWKWRKKLSGQLQTKMGSYYGGTMSAILLGEKSGLDEEMRKLYQKNGMGHLLAISGVKTLKLDIPLVPETRINWAFVPLHIAIIYILKLCLDEEIIPRCRFPCSRGYFTKCTNWQKKQSFSVSQSYCKSLINQQKEKKPMAYKKYREMKVYEASGYQYKRTPSIVLKGQWLSELGFDIGEQIEVKCEDGRLIITKANEIWDIN